MLCPFRGDLKSLALFSKPISELEVRELYLLGHDGNLVEYIETDSDKDGLPDWWEYQHFNGLGQPADADPDFDGDVVYALQHREFAVAESFPERTLYRYTMRGEWVPFAGQPVTPRLHEIEHVSGESIRMELTLGVPEAVEILELRASVDGEGNSTTVALTDEIDATVVASSGDISVRSPSFVNNLTIPHDGESPLRIVTFVDYGALGGFEYVARLPLVRENGQYRALSPYLEVCRTPSRCGGAAAYVPGEHRAGVSMNATLSAVDR